MVITVWRPSGFVLALTLAICAAPAFGQPAAPARITLADALTRARSIAPESAARRAREAAARQAVDQAGRRQNPVFEFRQENWLSGVPRDALPLDTFAEVTQVVEIGGKRDARRGVAEAAAGVEEAAARLVDQQITREVTRAYLDAIRHRERQRALAEQTVDLAELVRVMGRRVAVGTAPESDLFKLRTEEARAGLELARSELAARRALVELGAWLGIEPAPEALELPAVPLVSRVVGAEVRARRPDLVMADRQLAVARQTERLETARGVPDPAINGGLKRTSGLNTLQFTVTMPLPLFARNNLARIVAAGAVKAAELELAAAERRARAEVQASSEAATRLAARTRDLRATLVDPARSARDAARAAYRAGALDVLRLVDAERVATDAALVVADLEIDAVAAAIEARLAAGEDPQP